MSEGMKKKSDTSKSKGVGFYAQQYSEGAKAESGRVDEVYANGVFKEVFLSEYTKAGILIPGNSVKEFSEEESKVWADALSKSLKKAPIQLLPIHGKIDVKNLEVVYSEAADGSDPKPTRIVSNTEPNPPEFFEFRLLSSFRYFCSDENKETIELLQAELSRDRNEMHALGKGERTTAFVLGWRAIWGGILPIMADGFWRIVKPSKFAKS